MDSPTTTDPNTKASAYEAIGGERVAEIVRSFYQRVAGDSIIGHFFFERDLEHIIQQQTAFATAMLGGPQAYRGKSLQAAHSGLKIRPPHFDRRQMLLREVMSEKLLPKDLADEWLRREAALRKKILNSPESCRD